MADDITNETAQTVAAGQLRAFIERVERLEEEKKTISEDIKEVYAEMKGTGFDTKAVRTLIRLRNAHEALREGEWTAVTPNSNRLYAFLRYTENETILVLFNLNPNPVLAADYSLELAEGPLSGAVTAVSLFGPVVETSPEVNGSGGFTGYRPLAEIPGQSVTIIQLQPGG